MSSVQVVAVVSYLGVSLLALALPAVVQPRYCHHHVVLVIHGFLLQVLAPEVHHGPRSPHVLRLLPALPLPRGPSSLLIGELVHAHHHPPNLHPLADLRPKHTRTSTPLWELSSSTVSKSLHRQ